MKNLNISNELLSNVLSMEVHSNSLSFDSIIFECSLPLEQKINLYKFAFLCKEWALTKGYFIYSTNELSFIKSFSLETIETFSNGKDTEIECIIKACEWLLKEQNNDTK